ETPPVPRDARQLNEERPIEQIGSRDGLLDSVEDDRSLNVEDRLLAIAEKLPGCVTPTGRDPAEGVREPGRDEREIVEREHENIARPDHEVTRILRLRAQRG